MYLNNVQNPKRRNAKPLVIRKCLLQDADRGHQVPLTHQEQLALHATNIKMREILMK